LKFFNSFDYKNNFNKFIYKYEDDLDLFVFNKRFIKNKFFLKKTNKGSKINIKYNSVRRNKNFSLNNLLINSWVKKGLKLNFLKSYNIFLENFFFILNNNKSFFKDYPNYEYVYDILKTKGYNYRFENLLLHPISELEYMFELKLKKLNKKLKKKLKKKYSYTINHFHYKKRVKHILNLSYLSSNFYKEKKYFERIFLNFVNIVFDTKNTPIWDRKINVYKIAFKFLNKK
jgi:hypothetical protein